jgi:plastocyanin
MKSHVRVNRMTATGPRGAAVLATAALLVLALGLRVGAAEIAGRVVDQQGNGLVNAVVFVDQLPPDVVPPDGERTATMDQINKAFVPHVLPVAVGTSVSFPNHDQIHHHVYSLSRPKTFEIPLYKGEQAPPVVFDQPGAVKLGCNIHDWMSGVILVVPTPYFALTDEQGAFTLRDLPPGRYGVVAWYEGSKTAIDDTRQSIGAGESGPVSFALDAAPPRRRPATRRGYE